MKSVGEEGGRGKNGTRCKLYVDNAKVIQAIHMYKLVVFTCSNFI